MNNYCIVTDPSANLPATVLEQKDIIYFDVPFIVNEITYSQDNPINIADFYAALRAGQTAETTKPSVEYAESFFRSLILERDMDIIAITVSSKLGVINDSMRAAAQNLSKEFPEHHITVIDSLSVSLGEGLLVELAVQFKQAGFKYNENIAWLEKVKSHIVHSFTVDDLEAMYRSNRISKMASLLGTLANIKLLLRVDNSGSLVAAKPIPSRKRAMEAIVDSIGPRIATGNYKRKNDKIYISHGDCETDALLLSQMITERYGYTEFLIAPLCPTLGCYAGPGALAVFFLGEYR